KLAVIGAGQMGAGIAQVAAQSGLEVVLIDVDAKLVEKSLGGIKAQLDKAVSKGKLAADAAQAAAARIRSGASAEDAKDCDFAVEAVTEYEAVKKKVFHDLSNWMRADAILASNTSSIPITRLAAASVRPERVIGMHFM